MTVLAIILALIIEHFQRPGPEWRKFQWFDTWTRWLEERVGEHDWMRSWGGLALVLGVPCLLVWLIFADRGNWLFMLLHLAFAVLILLYCLGPTRPREDLQEYFSDLEDGDQQGAFERAVVFTRVDNATDLQGAARNVSRAIFMETNRRFIAPIIWFALLGPAGALLYRLAWQYAEMVTLHKRDNDAIEPLLFILDWLPARVASLAYLLAGDMSNGLDWLKGRLLDLTAACRAMIADAGLGAINAEESLGELEPLRENRAALDLSERSLLLILGVVAALSIAGLLVY